MTRLIVYWIVASCVCLPVAALAQAKLSRFDCSVEPAKYLADSGLEEKKSFSVRAVNSAIAVAEISAIGASGKLLGFSEGYGAIKCSNTNDKTDTAVSKGMPVFECFAGTGKEFDSHIYHVRAPDEKSALASMSALAAIGTFGVNYDVGATKGIIKCTGPGDSLISSNFTRFYCKVIVGGDHTQVIDVRAPDESMATAAMSAIIAATDHFGSYVNFNNCSPSNDANTISDVESRPENAIH